MEVLWFDRPSQQLYSQLVATYGAKAAGLWAMNSVYHLPVPPGFALPLNSHRQFLEVESVAFLTSILRQSVEDLSHRLAAVWGTRPLTFSVRAGSTESMPGILDTILNVGLNEAVVEELPNISGDLHAWQTFQKFHLDYSRQVMGLRKSIFREAGLVEMGRSVSECKLRIRAIEGIAMEYCGRRIPADLGAQLAGAVEAVYKSWSTDLAMSYRELCESLSATATGVCVQAMVFGNARGNSCSGVVFSRDPVSGSNTTVGEVAFGQQGDAVVGGQVASDDLAEFEVRLPDSHTLLVSSVRNLETLHNWVVDVEFVVENGQLWFLQCRPGELSRRALLRVAVEMAEDSGLDYSYADALRDTADGLDEAPADAFFDEGVRVIATGEGVSDGLSHAALAVYGDTLNPAGRIIVAENADPAIVRLLQAASGLITLRGGKLCHVALVARSLGVPAMMNSSEVTIECGAVMINGERAEEDAKYTLDGQNGRLYEGNAGCRYKENNHARILKIWRHASTFIDPVGT